jgi:hypothetical protein
MLRMEAAVEERDSDLTRRVRYCIIFQSVYYPRSKSKVSSSLMEARWWLKVLNDLTQALFFQNPLVNVSILRNRMQ